MDAVPGQHGPACEAAGGEPAAGSYFVSAYPPFSTWTKEQAPRLFDVLDAAPPDANASLGLYVHVPFCVERCQYCYYLSYANHDGAEFQRYTAALVRELAMLRERAALTDRRLSFVYFGGGTPSLLSAATLERLMGELQRVMPWDVAREVTFECAPRTVTEGRLRVLRAAGITRLSMGVQQLNDEVLQANGRVHLVRDVERAWSVIRAVGFDVVNVDLIAGLVGETDRTFFESLARVIDMQPESVTIYLLEIPLNTPLYRALSDGSLDDAPPEWTVKRERLLRAFEMLEAAGYAVRSAYAAVRDPNRHEFVYQDEQYRGADLLGLGAASFGYVSGVHYQNRGSLEGYLAAIDGGTLPAQRAHALSDEERCVREFVLPLKLGRVEREPFARKFGVDAAERFAEPIGRFVEQGWMQVDASGVSLTRAGLVRVDRLIPEFYLPEHRGVRYS